MKVFISWSGDHGKQIGEAIRDWLPNVLHSAEPYFTPSDTDKGSRWDNEISKELGQSQIGIFVMTKEALTSSWVMFEAGAISKVVDESRVCPILFGIKKSDITGPLAKFQATDFNEVEVHQLLKTINKAAEKPLTEQRLDVAFKKWWPDLEEKVQAISSAEPTKAVTHRNAEDLLEEVVENTRAIIRELHTLNPQVAAHVQALLGGRTSLQAILDLKPATPS